MLRLIYFYAIQDSILRYIGSSNLSNAALTNGLEWNIKVTQTELPYMVASVRTSFETYWRDCDFEVFRNGLDDERLRKALSNESSVGFDYDTIDVINARDYQNEILEKLRLEREVHHSYRNLIVAATGKTVIAAFDYKNFCKKRPEAKILFVAHREEILKQSIKTFRMILDDYNFGDLWYRGVVPNSYSHLFASKDLLNNRLDSLNLAPDYYDYIVIDEVHHAAAATYQKLLRKFNPKILLGLTTTPERMDGEDITKIFDDHISAELRLDTALNNNLLCPFHYYGITDCIDLLGVKWNQGKYDISELTKLYTENGIRAIHIIKKLSEYLTNERDVRALCFCVSQEHAKYMAEQFTVRGNLKADYLVSENSNERDVLYRRLKDKRINYLFVVDMFNEGVDIPEVDTILFLRPTESLTIFLQQFGRGLRKLKGKYYVNVLDFVGQCRDEFNYTDRFRALIGRTSMSVKEEIEEGFPHLPLDCQIFLERKAQEYILQNVNKAIKSFSRKKVIRQIQTFKDNFDKPLTLTNFVSFYKIPLEKLYKRDTWNGLCFLAGIFPEKSSHNENIRKAMYRKWMSTDSYSYFDFIKKLAHKHFCINVDTMNVIDKKRLMMFYYDFCQQAGQYNSLQDFMDDMSADEILCDEIEELMTLLQKRCQTYEKDDNSMLLNFPLKLHGIYTREQIHVAIGTSTLEKQSTSREGVERNRKLNIEVMYVDIIKDREEGSSTNYDDHALSDTVFQWDTQNNVSPSSPTGQNYIHQTQTTLLFIRQQSNFPDDKNRTMGYVYLGRTKYISHTYNQVNYGLQMQILWKMLSPIPASVISYAKIQNAM